MLNFCSLYSGSSGNSLFVQSEKTNILVDAGVSCKKIVSALESIDINPDSISAILITHEHKDHIAGLATISKKYNIPVYANEMTWKFIEQDKLNSDNIKLFTPDEIFTVNDMVIQPFRIPHDAADPCGFNISVGNSKISIATDLGYIDDNIFSYLKDSSFVLLESNYDPEVLKLSSYPSSLKRRITGPEGHLSNNTAAQVITTLFNYGLKSAMLGHLSKETNFPELAYHTVLNELHSNNITENDLSLCVASRFEPSKIINI